MKGQHKVSVTVEIDGEDTVTFHQGFSGGNPAYHSWEFSRAVKQPIAKINKALEGVFGTTPGQRKVERASGVLEAALEEAKSQGASVFRAVLIKGGTTYMSEALNRRQFENEWLDIKDDPTLEKVQYGVKKPNTAYEYTWYTL